MKEKFKDHVAIDIAWGVIKDRKKQREAVGSLIGLPIRDSQCPKPYRLLGGMGEQELRCLAKGLDVGLS